MHLVIYGAQGYALGAYKAIRALYPRKIVSCFLVSAPGNNARFLGGLPVKTISMFAQELSAKEKRTMEVLIATPEQVQPEIEEALENYGFPYYQRLTSVRWAELMKLFHVKHGCFRPLTALPVGVNKPFLRVYMAKHERDVPLKSAVTLPEFVQPVQVGAAASGLQVAALRDTAGESISARNGNYSELTGLFWVWRNKLCADGIPDGSAGQYFGLAQYRRMLGLSDDDLLRLVDNDVDVVLPYPMPYEPNIHAHHERYLKEADWNALLTALKELQPEYAEYFPQVLEQQYLYNYNVILAKKQVLKDYCEWLFPILERVEELSVPKGSERADRYIGYMGETLETLYFIKNREKLNVVHTECKLYV